MAKISTKKRSRQRRNDEKRKGSEYLSRRDAHALYSLTRLLLISSNTRIYLSFNSFATCETILRLRKEGGGERERNKLDARGNV